MNISTKSARQGTISENHAVAKVAVISTTLSFVALLAILFFF